MCESKTEPLPSDLSSIAGTLCARPQLQATQMMSCDVLNHLADVLAG